MEIPSQIEQYYRVYTRFVGIKDAEEKEKEEKKEIDNNTSEGECVTHDNTALDK